MEVIQEPEFGMGERCLPAPSVGEVSWVLSCVCGKNMAT